MRDFISELRGLARSAKQKLVLAETETSGVALATFFASAGEGEAMDPLESIRVALEALAANKLRSGLTMLGIVIGVGAVIALMSIGSGAQAAIAANIKSLGANLITITPGVR